MGSVTKVTDIATRHGLPRTLSGEDCVVKVRELVAEGGRVVFRQHAFDRMEERDISNAQVFHVLRRGNLIEGPAWSAKYGNWEFLLSADTAGEVINVKAALEVEQLMGQVVVVVTTF